MFLKNTHVEASNKNGLDFFLFHQLLKHVECLLLDYHRVICP